MIYTDDKIEEILYRENIKIPSFSHRVSAFIIDIFLVVLITWGVYINFLSTSSSDIQTKIYSIQKLILIYFFLELSYEVICLRYLSASIGKMIFGIKVISLLDLDRPVLKTIFQRSTLKVFEEIFGFVLFIFAIDNRFYRGLHDKVSKTLVVSDR
ncbi:RDD family protein [Helicobacter cappadocius]|uniref:RDD family protein n=1 Tax=Helicobacter cappadocius TaxID=3063998 RepID=A0AA90PL72_9HELI|nr:MULTISPECIES: RDD family protein [unclassified Helicobacter]MDO7253577.1 RDD family protein [Helicobacter sp. faydin-H75]MDP2539505.1 RDD family protein [Helicobacter sp. faydin-H76]